MMNREKRYTIFKLKDVEKYLIEEERQMLERLALKVDLGRYFDNKGQLNCVVVESDWPEYESVWKMIEDRVDKGE